MNQEVIMSKKKVKVYTGKLITFIEDIKAMNIKQLNYEMMRMKPKLCT